MINNHDRTFFLAFNTFHFVTLYIPLVSTMSSFKFSSGRGGGEVFNVDGTTVTISLIVPLTKEKCCFYFEKILLTTLN